MPTDFTNYYQSVLANPTATAAARAEATSNLGSSVIPASNIAPATPLRITAPTPDTTNYPSITGGVTDSIINDYTALNNQLTASQNQQNKTGTEITNLMEQLTGRTADTAAANETAGVNTETANLNRYVQQLADLNAKASSLNREAQAIPIQTQERNANTGATDRGVAPQDAGALRLNALKALSIGQQSDIAAAAATGSQLRLQAAKDKAQQIIDLKYKPIEDALAIKEKQYELNKDVLASIDKKRTEALGLAIDKEKTAIADAKEKAKDNSALAHEWAKNAFDSGQPDIASQIVALDPSSKTFNADLSKLQAKIKVSPDFLYKQAQTAALNSKSGLGGGAGSGALNVASSAGITDTTISLAQAISDVGIDKIVAGIINNEGGSLAGVKNNPGNMKFVGAPGQTDSGVKASDGGTYANYATLAAGKKAIADQIQIYANKGMSFQDALNTYTGTSGAAGAYTPGTDVTVDSWAQRIQNGTAKITEIPASQAALRNKVTVALQAMGNSAEGKPTTTELGKSALQTAKSLLNKFDAGKGTSAVGKSSFLNSFGYGLIPGTDRANFVNDFNSVKAQLSLEGVKYLKGQGTVSDSERALLAQAVTKLNLSQSEPEFRTTLNEIINRLQGNVSTDQGTTYNGITLPGNSSSNTFQGVTLPN